jgi:hypothetical protein
MCPDYQPNVLPTRLHKAFEGAMSCEELESWWPNRFTGRRINALPIVAVELKLGAAPITSPSEVDVSPGQK